MFGMKSLQLVILLCGSLFLSACVTTSDSRLSRKADPVKAVENYTQLGLGYIGQGKLDIARARLNRALEINPNYAPANNAMALLLQTESEPELAEEYFLKSIDLDGDFSQGQYNYGMFLMQHSRYSEACKHLKNAARDVEYQQRGKAYQNLGLCYYRNGQMDLAISTYERTLKSQRYNAPILVNLTTLLVEAERQEEAMGYYERFLRIVERGQNKQSSNSLWLGIKLAKYFEKPDQEKQLVSQLKQEFPKSKEYKLYKASL
ncbi:type IV pilus biogenesis/stability protein PilW [Oleispira antarctica]|uniref:Type IV pilus biogenesis/stability protein PilW n=1 Tax=Oleispira antarctica TaxID=188908 RepID=A0A1Y5H8A8_OLEAN|nr:type IV pilus biogenesis/stability protein PilW [Oleispira antarctica]